MEIMNRPARSVAGSSRRWMSKVIGRATGLRPFLLLAAILLGVLLPLAWESAQPGLRLFGLGVILSLGVDLGNSPGGFRPALCSAPVYLAPVGFLCLSAAFHVMGAAPVLWIPVDFAGAGGAGGLPVCAGYQPQRLPGDILGRCPDWDGFIACHPWHPVLRKLVPRLASDQRFLVFAPAVLARVFRECCWVTPTFLRGS